MSPHQQWVDHEAHPDDSLTPRPAQGRSRPVSVRDADVRVAIPLQSQLLRAAFAHILVFHSAVITDANLMTHPAQTCYFTVLEVGPGPGLKSRCRTQRAALFRGVSGGIGSGLSQSRGTAVLGAGPSPTFEASTVRGALLTPGHSDQLLCLPLVRVRTS